MGNQKTDAKKVSIKKTATVGAVEKKQNELTLTLEKFKNLDTLVKKRTAFYNAIKKLDTFSLDNENMETKLTITEGFYQNSETTFHTSNNIIIDGVAEFIKKDIFNKLEKIEAEILALK